VWGVRATGLWIPFSVVTLYYVVVALLAWYLLRTFPGVATMVPIGSIDHVVHGEVGLEQLLKPITHQAAQNVGTLTIALASSLVLMIPVSWTYVLTHDVKEVEASFVQTIIVLPVVVAGIAMIVQHSVALAFSLAGIVAAVRFRFALETPSQAVFIFAAITVGLAAGIGALEVAALVSVAFVYVTMLLWKLDYGDQLGGRFLSLFTGRRGDD
jgi:hypothetical protein